MHFFPYIFAAFHLKFVLSYETSLVLFDIYTFFFCVAFDAVIFGSPDSYGLLGDQRLC